MTIISQNSLGIKFRGTEQLQSNKIETNPKKDVSQKGMSNTIKVGIGLSVLATIVIAGLAIKKGLSR